MNTDHLNVVPSPSLEGLFLSQLGETATVTLDPEHGTQVVNIQGTIDVAALVALAFEEAERVARNHYVTVGNGAPLRRPTPSELAMEYRRLAGEARA
jgi:hypothetical protein